MAVIPSTTLEYHLVWVTNGQMTEDMITNYLAHHFEADPNDNFKTEYGEPK